MNFPHGETVTLLTSTTDGQDSTGEPIPGADQQTTITGCAVWLATSKENLDVGVAETTTDLVVAFPAGTIVPANARARIRGEEYAAVAAGFDYTHPMTGWEPGTTATFRKVTPDG